MFTNLLYLIHKAWIAHRQDSRTPEKAVRRHDGHTPYAVHPVWCAMTVLAETGLLDREREILAQALLYHDVLEDTTQSLPVGMDPEAVQLVEEMTFASFQEEMTRFDEMSSRCRLAKLYDKTNNLMDWSGTDPVKRERYIDFTLRLADFVERTYGGLNIVWIARAVCARLNWATVNER